jgi:hypothetical protein
VSIRDSVEHKPEAASPATLTRATLVLWTLFAAWLPAGFLFREHIHQFGWGFIPFITWFYSFPFVAAVAAIASIRNFRRSNFVSRRSAVGWLIIALVYLLITIAWHTIPELREWVITGEWQRVE